MRHEPFSTSLRVLVVTVFSSLALLLYPLTANAQTGTFSATGSMTTARGGATATLLPSRMLKFEGS